MQQVLAEKAAQKSKISSSPNPTPVVADRQENTANSIALPELNEVKVEQEETKQEQQKTEDVNAVADEQKDKSEIQGDDQPKTKANEGQGLKLQINPTEVVDPSIEQAAISASIPIDEASKNQVLETVVSVSVNSQKSPDPAEPKEATSPVSPSKLQDQDLMVTNDVLLSLEAEELKVGLLKQVDEIIQRQNQLDPVAKIETFQIETASRRVLKELVDTYTKVQEDQNKKLKDYGSVNDKTHRRIEAVETMLKRIQAANEGVLQFGKKLNIAEQKIDTQKDQIQKHAENTKEIMQKNINMLDAKADQIGVFEDKITILSDDFSKNKSIQEDWRKKQINEFGKSNSEIARVKSELNRHLEEYKSTKTNDEFYMDKVNSEITNIQKSFEQQKVYVDGRFQSLEFDISRKVSTEDMKQNFKQLNDILLIKFKQVEDTKEACRNLITYQKFFHDIKTQQLISENLMALKVARQDENFMTFQKKVYDDFNERTRLECKMAQKIKDYDLEDHKKQLENYHIKGNDFMPFPVVKDVQNDFVNELLYNYLQDIKHREKSGEFGRATAAVLLRKCTKLDDIEIIIEDLQAKSNDLLSNAEKMSLRLAEESRQKEIANNINRLSHKKLEFKANKVLKRQNSWKGIDDPLFNGFEVDEYYKKMDGENRPKSREMDRSKMNRQLAKENNPGLTAAGSSAFSRPDGEEDDDQELKPQKLDQQQQMAGLLPDQSGGMPQQMMALLQQMASAAGGQASGSGTPGEGGVPFPFKMGGSNSLDRQEKRKLMAEIKEEMKVLITQISDYQVEQAVTIVKTQLRKLEQDNELDKKRIVERFEKELENTTEYFKKAVDDVRKDFTDDIGSMKKLRARDKSDADVKFIHQGEKIYNNCQDLLKYHDYFNCIAQSISIITENINMQMESENSDLLDRKLMALYGVSDNKPSKMDIAGTFTKQMQSQSKNMMTKGNQDNMSVDIPTQATGTQHQGSKIDINPLISRDNSSRSSEERTGNYNFQKDGSVEQYLDTHIPRIDSLEGSQSGRAVENIRQTSGTEIERHDLPIRINQKCLAHQTSGQDSQLTLRLFKLACLAYSPSQVVYRGMTLDRNTIIKLRRGLIDKISALLPTCELFKDNAIYPRRYFDDLMIDDRNTSNVGVGTSPVVSVLDQLAQIGSMKKINDYGYTSAQNLNSNSSHFLPGLPDIRADHMAFGIGDKQDYTASLNNSKEQLQNKMGKKRIHNQSMTIDVQDITFGRNNEVFMPMIKTVTNRQSVSQLNGNLFGAKDKRLQMKNFDIDGIIKNPNTNTKKYALGHQMNIKKLTHPESSKYSKAPMVMNSLSNISPAMMRGKRSGPGANLSMSIDVDSLAGLGDSSFDMSQTQRQQMKMKVKPNRQSRNLTGTSTDFPRI